MPKGYLIDEQGIKRLREDHEILYKRVVQLEQRFAMGGGAAGAGVRVTAEFVKVSDQITQRVDKKLGAGKAKIYRISKDELTSDVTFEEIKDDNNKAIEVDVYNSSTIPIPEDTYITITRDFRSGLWMNPEIQVAVAKAGSSGVPARSGTTAGYGDVSVYYVKSGVLEDTGETVRAYNMSATAVADDAWITIKRAGNLDDWIVDAEDCG